MRITKSYRNHDDGTKTLVHPSKTVPYANTIGEYKTDSEVMRSFLQVSKGWKNIHSLKGQGGARYLNSMHLAIMVAINAKINKKEPLKQVFSIDLIQKWLKNALNLYEDAFNLRSYMETLCQIGLFDKVRKSRQRVVYKFRSVQ